MGKVEKSIEVNAPVEECYAIWTDFERFPRFMKNVEEIRHKGDPKVLHWEVKGPLGKNVEWDAEVDSLQPNQAVSWHSVRNAEVDNSGAVTFESLGGDRTRVNVVMVYEPPAGAVGEFVADIFKNPDKMVEEDLNNFKQLVETEDTGVSSRVGTSDVRSREGGNEQVGSESKRTLGATEGTTLEYDTIIAPGDLPDSI